MKKHLPSLVAIGALLVCPARVTLAQNPMPETPSDVKAAPADAIKTASGLASKILSKGTGSEHPSAADTVTVHYSGWTTDGKMFDSSVKRGEPASFPLGGVIKGWTEGVQLMVEGEKRRFWIPADLAYGENPGGGRPGGLLVFDIELISIKKAPKPPELQAPADAEKSASGVSVKTVKKGTGAKSPKSADTVRVNLTLWGGDGRLLESTEQQGGPASIPLDKLRIGGLPDAIQSMVDGEKKIVWIPANVHSARTRLPARPQADSLLKSNWSRSRKAFLRPPPQRMSQPLPQTEKKPHRDSSPRSSARDPETRTRRRQTP